MSEKNLELEILTKVGIDKKKTVVIRGDQNVPYKSVMKVIDIANKNKLKNDFSCQRKIMAILDTTHKRKSTLITSVILIAFLWIIFSFGMQYQDPPAEYGIALNFGTTEQGSGKPKKHSS